MRRASMERLTGYLRDHPLVWIVPVLFVLACLFVAWMIARTPDSPYLYRI